jgi:hypothetical protein
MARATRSFYDAVRKLGGDIMIRPCAGKEVTFDSGKSSMTCRCNRQLRAKLPHDDRTYVVFCGICDRGFDFPKIRARMG